MKLFSNILFDFVIGLTRNMFKSFSMYNVVQQHYILHNIRKKPTFILSNVSDQIACDIHLYILLHACVVITFMKYLMFIFVDEETTRGIRVWVLCHETHVKHCPCRHC